MYKIPPILTAAKAHGINSFSELIDRGLYSVTVPPKHTVEEIEELLYQSEKNTESKNLSANH